MERGLCQNNVIPVFLLALSIVLICPATSLAEESPAFNPPTDHRKTPPTSEKYSTTPGLGMQAATQEWSLHKTADNLHPSGIEQQQLWFVNRARANPIAEGRWLATETHNDVSSGRNYFDVNTSLLQSEFAQIAVMPPAAFDRRLYEAAKAHSQDLIDRDAQDHIGQFGRVETAGFTYSSISGVVFSYTRTGLYAHAAFNIDWGGAGTSDGDDGMQEGRGHRVALMSDGREYYNVGISSIEESNQATSVGPYVTTGNYAKANASVENHFNAFIVGTVWSDVDGNGWYDVGEGLAGVTVNPSTGTYYAVTANSGGYAIPITATGAVTIDFSGGDLSVDGSVSTVLSNTSKLVDYAPVAYMDLIVESPGVSETVLTPGQTFMANATVRNQGAGLSFSTTLRYYHSSDSIISTGDTQISTDTVPSLAANGSSTESATVTAPTSTGTYWIGACVDFVIGELNSGNNCSTGVQVTVSNFTYPDLIVQFPAVSHSTLTPGQSFTASVTVRNQGTGLSSSTTLKYYRSDDSIISTGDTQISTDTVPSLAANGSSTESATVTAPTSTGTYWIGACVDVVSGERDIGNNCSQGVRIAVDNDIGDDFWILFLPAILSGISK